MKEVMVLRDPKKIKIIFNKWRAKILEMLSKKPHTIKEMADILKINPGTVFHHINILKDADLVEIIREELLGNITMRYYQSVAREFRFDLLETKDTKIHSLIESKLEGIVNALKYYGIVIPDKDKKTAEKKIAELWDLENKIKESIEVNPTIESPAEDIRGEVFLLASLLKLSKNEEYIKKRDELLKYLDKFKFGKAARELYNFFWHDFCDKYIEESKLQLQKANSKKERENTERMLLYVLVSSLKLLHPFVPFITEEIYQNLPVKKINKYLVVENWPK